MFLKNIKILFLITGNHEYYSTLLMSEIDYLIQNIVKKYDNIHFLNNKTVVINNINFIGTTMWCNVERW
jgi:predicted phosphohydrolase